MARHQVRTASLVSQFTHNLPGEALPGRTWMRWHLIYAFGTLGDYAWDSDVGGMAYGYVASMQDPIARTNRA